VRRWVGGIEFLLCTIIKKIINNWCVYVGSI